MKTKALLLILISFLMFHSYSQEYVPFPDTNTVWSNLFDYSPEPSSYSVQTAHLTLRGDTLIKGETYTEIYVYYDSVSNPLTDEYAGGIREDSAKRIYFYGSDDFQYFFTFQLWNTNDTTEKLLYDFSIDIGDSIKIENFAYPDSKYWAVGIDSIQILGKYRKRYEMRSLKSVMSTEYWIEGIGSTKGLFFPLIYDPMSGIIELLCFETNNELIMHDDSYETCHYEANSSDGFTEDLNGILKIYPNPVKDFLNIEVCKDIHFEIINCTGSIMLKKDMNTKFERIDVTDYSHGVYILKVYNNDKTFCTSFLKIKN